MSTTPAHRNHSMKIRWQISDEDNKRTGKHKRLVALLVDRHQKSADKIDNVVARLGSIEERFLNVNVRAMRDFHKGIFWTVVDKKLDELNLALEERSAIENDISEKIPRPCDEWALWGVTCIPRFESE